MLHRFVGMIAVLVAGAAFAQDVQEAAHDAPTVDEVRPVGPTVGIGVGWTFPQSILEPNTVSVRVRFAKFELEPVLNLGGGSGGDTANSAVTSGDQAPVTDESQNKRSSVDLQLGTNLRYAVLSKGPVDLVGIGGASVAWNSNTVKQDVTDTTKVNETTQSTFTAALNYGIGVQWFVGHGVSLSADATNPLISYTNTSQHVRLEQTLADVKVTSNQDTSTNVFNYALTFRPTVRVLAHLYF